MAEEGETFIMSSAARPLQPVVSEGTVTVMNPNIRANVTAARSACFRATWLDKVSPLQPSQQLDHVAEAANDGRQHPPEGTPSPGYCYQTEAPNRWLRPQEGQRLNKDCVCK